MCGSRELAPSLRGARRDITRARRLASGQREASPRGTKQSRAPFARKPQAARDRPTSRGFAPWQEGTGPEDRSRPARPLAPSLPRESVLRDLPPGAPPLEFISELVCARVTGRRVASQFVCRSGRAFWVRSPHHRGTQTERAAGPGVRAVCASPSSECVSSRSAGAPRRRALPLWMASYATKRSSLSVAGFRVFRPVAADSPAFKRSARTSSVIAVALRTASALVAPDRKSVV